MVNGTEADGEAAPGTTVESASFVRLLRPSDSGGVVDDALEIRAAFEALAEGGLLVLGPGHFRIASRLDVPTGVVLRGSATAATVLHIDDRVRGDAVTLAHAAGISDLTLSPVGSSREAGALIGIDGNECVVERCTLVGYFVGIRVGTRAVRAVSTSLSGLSFRSPHTGSASGAIDLVNFASTVITGCVMSSISQLSRQCLFGIRVGTGDTAMVSDTNITSHGAALLIATEADESCWAFQATNCLFDSAGGVVGDRNASSAEITPKGEVRATMFANCWFGLSEAGHGLRVAADARENAIVEGLSLSNCHFLRNGRSGLSVSGSGITNWSVTGGYSVENEESGIEAVEGTSSFAITGHSAGRGRLPSTPDVRRMNEFGIRIGEGCDDYLVTGCRLSGNERAALVDEANAAGRLVEGNLLG
ncbi:hypothetical protein GSU68_03185 [Rathayibacter sp. VKM Ac-2759]|uniref:hypothetical protein n=1 Tax=Rathayibacter sp. VKM Ac-2759 TaxID=2609252 RepID=UPI0013175E4B|nr:hypothetical protein [Rathayibacter sp. VKM Ac-2759]QHC65681.1 hypothetical protein GSU68_03185 [Rathayibacter sp. VKM Ac-2759]